MLRLKAGWLFSLRNAILPSVIQTRVPQMADLRGLWRRSLISWPDSTLDTTTSVRWLQGTCAYVDLRQPAALGDFSGRRGLADLTMDDCSRLAEQQGFAGRLTFDGTHFEWSRSIDFQPKALHVDAGSLCWEDGVRCSRRLLQRAFP
jgi:hypothetical protein